MVIKAIGGCVSSERLEIVTPSPHVKEKTNKLLVLIGICKYEVIKTKILYIDRIRLMR